MIQTTTSKVVYNGAGSVGPYTFTFRFFANSDIVCIKNVAGVNYTLAEGVGYTLTGAGSYAGGSVTLTYALNSGETLTIYRSLALTQPTSIRNQSAFFPAVIEDEFDRLCMQIQQVMELASTIGVTVSSTGSSIPLISTVCTTADKTVDINGLTAVICSKEDSTAHIVHVLDSSGATIEGLSEYRDGLQGYCESVFLVKSGTNWIKA